MLNIIEITDFSIPELDIYARLNENQLFHLYEPNLGIFIAETTKVIERAFNAGYTPLSFLLEKKHIEGEAKDILSRCDNIPVYTASICNAAAERKIAPIFVGFVIFSKTAIRDAFMQRSVILGRGRRNMAHKIPRVNGKPVIFVNTSEDAV